MPRKKTLFVIDKQRGVIRGNFHEFKSRSDKALRKDLCTIEEADYKTTARGKKKRNESEKANFLLQLYEKKKQELTELEHQESASIKQIETPISALFSKWLDFVEHQVKSGIKNKDTHRKYKTTVKYYLEANRDHVFEGFNSEKVNIFFEFLNDKGLSRRSIWGHSIDLKTCFNWLYEENIIDKEVRFRNPKKPTTVQASLSHENVEELESKARSLYDSETDPNKKKAALNRVRAIVLARYTGMRGAEIWSLKLEDVDFSNNRIYICKKVISTNTRAGLKTLEWIPKQYEEREIEISTKLKNFLEEDFRNRSGTEKFYLDNGEGVLSLSDAGKLTRLVRKVAKKGTKPLHSIRSQVITKLLDSGFTVEWVQKFAGHKDRQTTWSYYQSSKKGQKGMVDVL